MTEEFRDKIIKLGQLGYPAEKCARILELAGEEFSRFVREFGDPKSETFSLYQIGVDQADFEIDTKLFLLAKSGDMKALAQLDERKRQFNRKKN